MNTDSLVIIATMIIGFIGVFVMLSQINARFDAVNTRFDAVNTRFDNLRTEFKSDMNTLEIKLNTLLMGLFRDYNRPNYPPKEDKTA